MVPMLLNLLANTVYYCCVLEDVVQEKCTSIFISLCEKG
jgi:hypothetical protein